MVDSGVYPRLAEIIAPKIKINGGTLTVYDPRLGGLTSKDTDFYREKFTLENDVSKYSTIIGMSPCGATTIVEQALNNDKNFLIVCCDCDHSDKKYPRYNFGKYLADDFAVMLKDDYGDEIDILK